ncbi:MAG: FHA domain-containing protein [Paludisphaera borealis]|uniref:FHA domain-containing protein n=1 Tax=Paludisphaera borealis TaxID=1387353 RepID=UPI002840ED52|nr:FHA domain-containing protein [Paludisphaera borealis]MDR3620347.1 FHA domain-containing protein [Paludisphaera borealis]
MSFKLTPIVQRSGPPIMVQRPILLIGRHPECDLRLDLPKISRRHCCLASAYDRVLIRDLGSRNGVRVNGRVVDETQLFRGDEVAIGPLIYRVDDEEGESPGGGPHSRPAATPAPGESESHVDLIPLDDV